MTPPAPELQAAIQAIAERITASSLVNPRGAAGAAVNCRIALLALATAGHHLSLSPEPDQAEAAHDRQFELETTVRPHVDALTDDDWRLFGRFEPGREQASNCTAWDDTRGRLALLCSNHHAEEQRFPCLKCPFLTEKLGDKIGRVINPPLTPAAPPPQHPQDRQQAT